MSIKQMFKPVLLLLFVGVPVIAPAQNYLEGYIKEGLESNLALRQKNLNLEQAMYSLKIAQSYFLPSLSLSGGYTHGNGGRSIALPVGDLLNPVYSTLNQLTDSKDFLQIDNVSQSFFPSHFADAHLRAAVPLVNTNLNHTKSIRQGQVQMKEMEVKIFERELVKNISIAYYQFLGASDAVRVYASALELVKKNRQVNESMFRNGKGLHASVLRSDSELETVKAQLEDAKNSVKIAGRYFNFLLNRPEESFIAVPENIASELEKVPQALSAPTNSDNREEMQLLRTSKQLGVTVLRMNEQFWVPQVNAFLDLGAQAENWKWNERSRYYLVGISLDMPLFSGFRHSYQSRYAMLGLKEAELKLEEGERQLKMGAENSKNNLLTAWLNYGAANQRLQASQSYFRLIERGYAEGTYSLIEFIDARNQLTSAQLQKNIQIYKTLSAFAQYQRDISSYPINH